MQSIILREFTEHIEISNKTIKSSEKLIQDAANLCIKAFKKGNKILLFGNGGSAADAQHIAAELVGRFKSERRGLPAIALNTDTSSITSISNDYGYSRVFERQLEALANKGDVVIGISTGGTSENVVNALICAKNLGCKSIGLSGKKGGKFNSLCNINIIVPSDNVPRIQEMHIVIGHTICQLIDTEFDV
jgi:D-sedoheptulose 7-phosphate isomerase